MQCDVAYINLPWGRDMIIAAQVMRVGGKEESNQTEEERKWKLKKETMYVEMMSHFESSESIIPAYRLIGLLFLQQLLQFTRRAQRREGNIFKKKSRSMSYRIDSNLNDTMTVLSERVFVVLHLDRLHSRPDLCIV